MERCRQCEATMTKDEQTCISCGASKIPPPKSDFKTKGRTMIHYFFLLSAVMTVMSLLTPWGPPFMMSVCVTLVLLLVKSSWNEMLADREEK
jgi:hypothetical protein